MKKIIFFFLFLFSFSFLFSQMTFQKVYGGIHDDHGVCGQQTFDGGYFAAGYTLSFGSGYFDYYLVKTDSTGSPIWTATYGISSRSERLYSACQTSDSGFVLCGTSYHSGTTFTYVVKTSSIGNLVWSNIYDLGSIVTESPTIHQTTDGGFIIFCQTDSAVIGTRSCIVKISNSGIIEWNKKIIGFVPSDIIPNSSSGYYLSGTYGNDAALVKMDISGNVIWSNSFGTSSGDQGLSVVECQNGDILLSSFTALLDGILLAKFSSAGNVLWSKIYWKNCLSVLEAFDVQEETSGKISLCGVDFCSNEGVLLNLDPSGNILFANIFYGQDAVFFDDISSTLDGGFLLTGSTYRETTATDSFSVLLVKTDSLGNSGCNQTTVNLNTTIPTTFLSSIPITMYDAGDQQTIGTILGSGIIIKNLCYNGINNLSPENKIPTKIFPNPFTEKTTIEILENTNERSEFEIFDVNGNVVRDLYFTGNTIEIQRENLSSGIYFYRIISKNEIVATGKMIAE